MGVNECLQCARYSMQRLAFGGSRHGRARSGMAVGLLSEFARLSNARVPFSAAYAKFLDTHSLPAVGLDDGFFKSIRETDVGRKIVL